MLTAACAPNGDYFQPSEGVDKRVEEVRCVDVAIPPDICDHVRNSRWKEAVTMAAKRRDEGLWLWLARYMDYAEFHSVLMNILDGPYPIENFPSLLRALINADYITLVSEVANKLLMHQRLSGNRRPLKSLCVVASAYSGEISLLRTLKQSEAHDDPLVLQYLCSEMGDRCKSDVAAYLADLHLNYVNVSATVEQLCQGSNNILPHLIHAFLFREANVEAIQFLLRYYLTFDHDEGFIANLHTIFADTDPANLRNFGTYLASTDEAFGAISFLKTGNQTYKRCVTLRKYHNSTTVLTDPFKEMSVHPGDLEFKKLAIGERVRLTSDKNLLERERRARGKDIEPMHLQLCGTVGQITAAAAEPNWVYVGYPEGSPPPRLPRSFSVPKALLDPVPTTVVTLVLCLIDCMNCLDRKSVPIHCSHLMCSEAQAAALFNFFKDKDPVAAEKYKPED